jgi:hypothetical protein
MTSSEDVKKYALLIERGLENHVFCDAATKRALTSTTEGHLHCARGTKCKVCVRVYLLAYLHAKSCKRDDCSVLYCDEVRAALLDNKLKVSKVILQTFFLSLQKADST